MELVDKLTKINNRECVFRFLSNITDTDAKYWIGILDIDNFVNVDMKIGSDEGDKILQNVASFLEAYPDQEFIARYGGDEFLIIIKESNREKALAFYEQLRKLFRKQKFISESSIYAKVPLTGSIGVSSFDKNLDIKTNLKSCEIALAMAKKQGRNRVVFYSGSPLNIIINKEACSRTLIGNKLRGNKCSNKTEDAEILEPYGVDIHANGDLIFADRGNHSIKGINQDGAVYNIAGTGKYGDRGDQNKAIHANLNKPSGVACDELGNIFIADTANHRIKKIDFEGIMTTYAGNGENGFEGDGGPAIFARLSRPGGVVVDKKGNVYTNDYGNNVIRKIDTNGIISTVAGSGEFGFEGDGGDAKNASINKPYGLGITPNGRYLFIADYGNHCVRMVDMDTRIINTICGNGYPGYTGDNGPGENSQLNGPFWICNYGKHSVLIADAENHCIRKYDCETGIINTLVGNGIPGYIDAIDSTLGVELNTPAGMIVDESNQILYIIDYANNAIRALNLNK